MKITDKNITITKSDFQILIELTKPCVYKAFTKDGKALYIGSSGRGAARFINSLHERYQLLSEADRIEVETFETKKEALEAERKAIEEMEPLYNGPHVCGQNYWMAARTIVIALLGMALWAGLATAQPPHQAVVTWTLSPDDTTTQCSSPNTCSQTVYRAAAPCSPTVSFVVLSANVGALVTTYTDPTLVPGNWCYAVSFTLNGVESVKSTYGVVLQPAPPQLNVVTVQ